METDIRIKARKYVSNHREMYRTQIAREEREPTIYEGVSPEVQLSARTGYLALMREREAVYDFLSLLLEGVA